MIYDHKKTFLQQNDRHNDEKASLFSDYWALDL